MSFLKTIEDTIANGGKFIILDSIPSNYVPRTEIGRKPYARPAYCWFCEAIRDAAISKTAPYFGA